MNHQNRIARSLLICLPIYTKQYYGKLIIFSILISTKYYLRNILVEQYKCNLRFGAEYRTPCTCFCFNRNGCSGASYTPPSIEGIVSSIDYCALLQVAIHIQNINSSIFTKLQSLACTTFTLFLSSHRSILVDLISCERLRH